MMRVVCLSLLAALGLGSGASAQLVGKREVVTDVGECFVKVAPAMSERFLQADPQTKEALKIGQTLASGHGACTRGRRVVTMTQEMIRGAIAEEFLRRRPELLEAAAAKPAVKMVRPPQGLAMEPFMLAYAECLSASHPTKSASLLRTARNSPEERAAILAYGELLKDCVPTDIAYHMNIPDLRAHIAYAMYRAGSRQLAGA